MFEEEYEGFWRRQVKGAEGQRMEMLQRDLTGTKKLLELVLYPVFGTLDGLILEFELVSLAGVKIYSDVFHPVLGIAFEEEHYITHAEKISRERFTFERIRARTAANRGYIYYPYSRDEIEKKPDLCQKDLYELIGRFGQAAGSGLMDLPVYEREVVRCALLRMTPFKMEDIRRWLQLGRDACRAIIRQMVSKGLVEQVGGGAERFHAFKLTGKARTLLYRRLW